jgi:hypothetical protein
VSISLCLSLTFNPKRSVEERDIVKIKTLRTLLTKKGKLRVGIKKQKLNLSKKTQQRA